MAPTPLFYKMAAEHTTFHFNSLYINIDGLHQLALWYLTYTIISILWADPCKYKMDPPHYHIKIIILFCGLSSLAL